MSAKTNGVVLREDFKLATKIFANAFNPPTISNPNGPGRIVNPKYDKDWNPVDAFQLTQSELRLEQPLVTTSAQYTFPILANIQNQAQQFPTETRLNLQDSFVPTRVGIYVGLTSGVADTTFPMYPYFNPSIFTAPDAIAGNTLFNGNLNLQINNKTFITKWGIFRHRCVNQTQQFSAAVIAATNAEQQDASEDGIYPMQPFVLLMGSQNLNLQLLLPSAISAVAANSRVIIRLEGILAQNSTVVN